MKIVPDSVIIAALVAIAGYLLRYLDEVEDNE